jgi:cytochrome c biogenesis protein CcmG/thiol:disulfide interchange protein DsbE
MKAFYLAVLSLFMVKCITAQELVVDAPAPLFSLNGVNGETKIALASYQGKVVYVDFWASWCVPCRLSFPFLSTLREQYASQGFEIIAVNLDENPQAALEFLQRYPVSYPVAIGFATTTPTDYQVSAMPSAFLIDAKGILRLKHMGFSAKHQGFLQAVVEKLLAEK